MTTDPIKQDDPLNEIFAPIQEEYDGGEPMLPSTIPEAKAAILANFIPKQALAAALEDEQPSYGADKADYQEPLIRNEFKAKLRSEFGLEPKGDNSGKGSDQDG